MASVFVYSSPMHLDAIRSFCLTLPESAEVQPFGDPIFTARGNWFAIYGEWKGAWSLSVRVEPGMKEVFQADPRFFRTPYLGHHNWVSLRVATDPDWEELLELVRASYSLAMALPRKKPAPGKQKGRLTQSAARKHNARRETS
jgi:predicted DNA-binding protein (MmcQ/YjbR family)